MSILRFHVPVLAEAFAPPGFLAEPLLTFGFHGTDGFRCCQLEPWERLSTVRKLKRVAVESWERFDAAIGRSHPQTTLPEQFRRRDLKQVLQAYGISRVTVLDLFDDRADLRLDMDEPIPAELEGRFRAIVDIGSVEHVFDTRRCLENLFSMLAVGGHILLHTPCRGYFDHGLHTFSPECILESLRLNGFASVWVRFTTARGVVLPDPTRPGDVILWTVARKERVVEPFAVPQLGRWQPLYRTGRSGRG